MNLVEGHRENRRRGKNYDHFERKDAETPRRKGKKVLVFVFFASLRLCVYALKEA